MHWILQENLFREENYDRLVAALERRAETHGATFSIHKVVPFVGELDPDPGALVGDVVVMGTLTLARVARERGWRPGVFANERFDYRVQIAEWDDKMLNAGGLVSRLADVSDWGDGPRFVRPVLDDKVFAGKCWLSYGDFWEWRAAVTKLPEEAGYRVDEDVVVLVAPTQEIFLETRFWVVDGRVVTGSVYKRGGRPWFEEVRDISGNVRPRVCDIAGALVGFGHWVPARAFVLDVAETPRGPKVVEVNCVNCAGFYAADVAKIVDAIDSMWTGRMP